MGSFCSYFELGVGFDNDNNNNITIYAIITKLKVDSHASSMKL